MYIYIYIHIYIYIYTYITIIQSLMVESMELSTTWGTPYIIKGHFFVMSIYVNPYISKLLTPLYSVGWRYLSIHKLQRFTRWSFGMDKLFYHTLYWPCVYICWYLDWSMLVIRPLNIGFCKKRYIMFQLTLAHVCLVTLILVLSTVTGCFAP